MIDTIKETGANVEVRNDVPLLIVRGNPYQLADVERLLQEDGYVCDNVAYGGNLYNTILVYYDESEPDNKGYLFAYFPTEGVAAS